MTDTDVMSGAIAAGTGIAGALQAIVARAQSDREFRTALLERPSAALGDQDAAVPAGIELRPVEAAHGTSYLVLPPAPAEGEVDDDALMRAAGGGTPLTVGVAVITALGVTMATVTSYEFGRMTFE